MSKDGNSTRSSEGAKILERVCQAVKEVHLCISTPGGSKHYESCVAARLIYWLDSIFFYGLKKQHKGYWPLVSKIASKSTLESLTRLECVTTSCGKGRAWLLLSLNESLLEALLATLEAQPHLLAKYYHPYALLRDSATFQILITLVSGLEHVGFDFPVDAPYLNTGILDSTFAKYVTEFEPVDAPLSNVVIEDSPSASLSSPKRANLNSVSVESPNPIMNSPMVKRRSHLRSSAIGSSNSLAAHKRVSFYSNDSDPVETSESSEDKNKSRGSLQRYKSEWILGGDDNLSERNESRKNHNRHLRRFQSELQLNRSEVQQRDPVCGLERGVPEGQEDPDRFNSLRNLNWLKNVEDPSKKVQPKTWNNSTLTKYALTLLSSMKSSFEAQKPSLDEERKRALFRMAREKASWANFSVPLPQEALSPEQVAALNREIDSEIATPCRETTETKLCQVIVDTLGLSNTENYKLFTGYLELYSGKPRHVNVLVGRKAVYITLGTSHSLFWSAALFDIIVAKVKSSYTQLYLQSIVSSVLVDFVDTSTTRLCASYLDLYLNTLASSTTGGGGVVAAETASELRDRWKPWLAIQTSNKDEAMEYLGAVFWEEIVLTSILNEDSSVLGPYKSGYLMFAWNKSRNWQPGFFVVKAGVLYQFGTGQEKVPVFMLPLSGEHCKGYGRNFLSPRPHTIEIQVDKRKNLLLAAASESEASDWLSTISYSSSVWDDNRDFSDSGHVSIAPVGVLISTGSVILFREEDGARRRITSSFVEGISAVGISGDEKDLFCTVEFTCREASEGEGDWVFYFVTMDEMERFVTALECPTQILNGEITASLRRRSLAFFS